MAIDVVDDDVFTKKFLLFIPRHSNAIIQFFLFCPAREKNQKKKLSFHFYLKMFFFDPFSFQNFFSKFPAAVVAAAIDYILFSVFFYFTNKPNK